MLLFTNENHTGSLRSEINALQHASFLETRTGTSDQRSSHDDLPVLDCKGTNFICNYIVEIEKSGKKFGR